MNTKVIKQKMKSVGNIKKITRTMEMVSVAKMKRATAAAHAYRPFIKSAKYILATIYNNKHTQHKLVKNINQRKNLESSNIEDLKNINGIIIILIAANKGLCGGYNVQVNKALTKSIRGIDKSKLSFVTIGKYAERMAKKTGANIIYSFAKNNISSMEATVITKEIIKRYKDNDNILNKVLLIHPYIQTGMSHKVSVEQVLPYDNVGVASFPSERAGDGKSFKYEPDESTIIETVIPIMIEAIITAAALETEAGEHAARMMAMKTATDNAGDLLHDLKLTFNNARQAKITQEIAELSSVA